MFWKWSMFSLMRSVRIMRLAAGSVNEPAKTKPLKL